MEDNNKINNYLFFYPPKDPEIYDGMWGGKYSGIPCPFLFNNECSIYEVRPYKCRRFIIFDDDNSNCGCANKRYRGYIHIYSEIIYEKIIGIYNKERNIDSTKIYDIRDYFGKNSSKPNGT